ncbi:PAQR family membrane homeostasis protein TrhA [Salipiger sp.]|uniref:PAQR family membrane homeostasis protein TrhA n=1 Tax=Salipiger sp. TaxID=2078585 RepID=UPI003A98848A
MTLTDLPHSMTEHIADGVVHVIGVALAVAAVTGLLVWASLSVPGQHIWPLAVYAVGLLASFSFSAAYNLTLHARARAVLRRFDHAAIYLLIAGTYTPMALLGMGNTVGVALLVIVWTLSGIGIALKLGWIDRWPRTGFLLYLSLGWIGAIAACPTLSAMPGAALALLLAGGLVFTVGTIFHTSRRIRFARAIWHGHVIAGAATHYAAVILIARLAG